MDLSNKEITFTAEGATINEELWKKLIQFPEKFDLEYMKTVQARKHRKKRTNKKWLKKYGYKQVMVRSKGWKVRTCADDGTWEFVKDESEN
jgi:hypothetical protein